MSENWSTRNRDLQTARAIMEQYANEHDSDALGLIEIVVNKIEKQMNFCLSGWVVRLAKHFEALYGSLQGDVITRQVITVYITQGQTLH